MIVTILILIYFNGVRDKLSQIANHDLDWESRNCEKPESSNFCNG